jgi:hypothetical protein
MIQVRLIIIIIIIIHLILLLLNIIVISTTTSKESLPPSFRSFFLHFSNRGLCPPRPHGAFVSFGVVYITLSHITCKGKKKIFPCARYGSKWGSRILTTLILNFGIYGRVLSGSRSNRVTLGRWVHIIRGRFK